jgi:hypothetical protein
MKRQRLRYGKTAKGMVKQYMMRYSRSDAHNSAHDLDFAFVYGFGAASIAKMHIRRKHHDYGKGIKADNWLEAY